MQVHDRGPERGPRTAMNERQIRDIWVQEPPRRSGPVTLVEYDPVWPATFAAEHPGGYQNVHNVTLGALTHDDPAEPHSRRRV